MCVCVWGGGGLIVGILTFMSRKNSILGLYDPEKCCISWYFILTIIQNFMLTEFSMKKVL